MRFPSASDIARHLHIARLEQIPRFLKRKRVKHVSQHLGALFFIAYLLGAGLFMVVIFFNWGIRAKIIDIPLFVTLWVAEVPIAVFLRYILSEGRSYRPQLAFAEQEQTYKEGNASHHGLLVTNDGEVGAQSCEGRLTLEINRDNVLDLPDAIITKQDFRPIEYERLCWRTGDAEVSIKGNQGGFLEVVRLVEPTDNLPLRLEIPTEKGWHHPLVGIKPSNYTGSLSIVSMNCKSVSLEFDILYKEKERMVKLDF